MTIQQVKEHNLLAAQQDLIELIEEFENDGNKINRSELDPKQKMVVVNLEKRGFITIAINGDITITEKSKEDTKMATKKVEKAVKVDEKTLKAVAKDLNDVLGLEPAIDLKANDLLERVGEEAGQIGVDPKTGKISEKLVAGDKKELQPETWEFLEENKMLGHLGEEVEEEPSIKKAAKPVVAEVEEVEEEEGEEPATKPAAKKVGKKVPAEKVKKEKTVRIKKEWQEGSLCQTIYLESVVGTKSKPITMESVLTNMSKTKVGKTSTNLKSMVKAVLNEAVKRELLIQSEKGFYKV